MRWVWLGWALGSLIIVGVSFAALEGYALARPDGLTLSQAIVDLFTAWPPSILIAGLLIGFPLGLLTCHFLWPWIPRQKRATCGQCGRTILLDQQMEKFQ